MNFKKLVLILTVVCLGIVILPGCSTTEVSTGQMVPATANFMAQVQLGTLINDKDIQEVYSSAVLNTGQPATIFKAMDKLNKETGIDLRSYSEIVVFGDRNRISNTDSPYIGAIISGNIDEAQIVSNIETQTGKKPVVTDYQSNKFYTVDTISFSFISDSVVVAGISQAVRDALDVHAGKQPPVSGLLLDTFNRLGDAEMKVAFAVPSGLGTESPAIDGLGVNLAALGKMDYCAVSLDKTAQDILVKTEIHFADATSLNESRDTVSGLILLKGMIQDQNIKNLLGRLKVSDSDLWLTLKLDTTVSEVRQIINDYK